MSGRKPFYGWLVVLAGALITGAGVGLFNNCTSVFIKPVCDALGFSRGQFSLYSTISLLTSTLLMPVYGNLFRRYGTKRFMLASAVVCSLVPVVYSLSSQLWHFYLAAFLNGIMINGISMMMVGTLISEWFRDRIGIATGIAFAGSGLVASVMIPITGSVIAMFGWRWAYRLIALLGLLLLLPTILLIVREKPAHIGLQPYTRDASKEDAARPEQTFGGLSRAEALKTPTFWLLFASIMGVNFCGAGLMNHTIPFLSDIGYSAALASGVASLLMLVVTVGKLLLGLIFDKFGPLFGSLFMGLCCIAYSLLALFAQIPVIPWIYGAVLGLGCAGGTVPISPLTTAYFGKRDFAAIFSLCSTASVLGAAIGPPFMGFVFDISGSYQPAIIALLTASILTTLSLTTAYRSSRRKTPPAEAAFEVTE